MSIKVNKFLLYDDGNKKKEENLIKTVSHRLSFLLFVGSLFLLFVANNDETLTSSRLSYIHTKECVSTIELVQHESHRQSGCEEESINVMQMFIVIGMFYALRCNKNKISSGKKCASDEKKSLM